MCFLEECLCPVGIYWKRSDVVVRMHQSICFPQGTLWIVYHATLVSQLLLIPASESHFFFLVSCQLNTADASVKQMRAFFFSKLFLIALFVLGSCCPFLFPLLAPCFYSSSSSAHQPPPGSSKKRPGSPGVAVVGAGQRRPVSCALLHGPDERASRQQLDGPLGLCQPRGHILHSIQVECTHQVTASCLQ